MCKWSTQSCHGHSWKTKCRISGKCFTMIQMSKLLRWLVHQSEWSINFHMERWVQLYWSWVPYPFTNVACCAPHINTVGSEYSELLNFSNMTLNGYPWWRQNGKQKSQDYKVQQFRDQDTCGYSHMSLQAQQLLRTLHNTVRTGTLVLPPNQSSKTIFY